MKLKGSLHDGSGEYGMMRFMCPDAACKTLAFLLLYVVFTVAPLAAQYRGLSLGLGGEMNLVALDGGQGYGAALTIENRLNRYFALSFHGNVTVEDKSTWDDILGGSMFMGIEAAMYLRFYFLSPREMRRGGAEVFIGAGGGVLAMKNGSNFRNSRGAPEFGGMFGLRFRLGSYLYLEPYIRAGYPFIGGAGVVLGLRFPARSAVQVVEVEKVAETAEPAIKDTFVLIFEPNTARFYNLSERAMYKNKDTLLKVIKLLDENPDARLLIEGYANPVLGTQTEARQTLKPLSENRAAYIANALIACGVSPDRLVSVGEGGNRPLVPREDRTNWEQNRRVELRFIW